MATSAAASAREILTGLHEVMAIFGQLNLLYEYDCEKRFQRSLTPQEVLDKSLHLDGLPDGSGHRPMVFRAVSLLTSLLRMHPSRASESYLEQFAASLERQRKSS